MFYWIAAILLISANAICVVANLLMLPGNWFMVGTLCIFMLAVGTTAGPDWSVLLIVLVLAAAGEILETFAGSVGAAKQGASRLAVVLSLVSSIAGSLAGGITGTVMIPIPVAGSALGALAGAAVGAFLGAWMGEAWRGSEPAQRKEIGTAAVKGRITGLFAKIAIGAAIFVVQLVSLWSSGIPS